MKRLQVIKQKMAWLFFLFFTFFLSQHAFCSSMEDLIQQFGQDYEALVPEKNSSVHSDYKLEQAALGTFYTTKALNLIYEQNREMMEKYDQMLEKYNETLEQNKELIRLLTIISKQGIENREDKPTLGISVE